MEPREFTFEISLSVLNHLGRNLYRSFATVLGEAISNSWDADSNRVDIVINKGNNSFFIKDDGEGMTSGDFQNKFLRIGYSKRQANGTKSKKGRPFIGRKGIGKLALLSCAQRVTVISKVKGGEYVGGSIDNTGLDKAITSDLRTQDYMLEPLDKNIFSSQIKGHKHGTIIYFEGVKEGIKSTLPSLRKIVALYFRFSLIDKSFKVYVNKKQVSAEDLKDLSEATQFAWNLNKFESTHLKKLRNLDENPIAISMPGSANGFLASVRKPSNLKIGDTEERASVDLFVNGRLRERDILKHIPTSRIAESYFYGEIHYNSLDQGDDRFTSSREGIVADDPKYSEFLEAIRKVIIRLAESWDPLRRKHKDDGDPENPSISRKQRKAEELYNIVTKDYKSPTRKKTLVDEWVDELSDDASFNFASYAECYVSENLIRQYIKKKKVVLTSRAVEEIKKFKNIEKQSKGKGNISIQIRKSTINLSYLSMDGLANLVDKTKDPAHEAALSRDANEYKPMRDALAHTALLTDEAKAKLTTVYANLKSRIIELLK